MKKLLALSAILALAACNKNLSIEQATYKDYPGMSAEKRAKCRAIDRAIAAGEQHAADHYRDDGFKFLQ